MTDHTSGPVDSDVLPGNLAPAVTDLTVGTAAIHGLPSLRHEQPRAVVTVIEDPVKHRHIKELRFRGWTVHVVDVAVVVPQQGLAGKTIQDLAHCLREAYVLAGVPSTSQPAAVDPRLAQPLIATLHKALRIAESRSARSHDIYRCTAQAWMATNMAVPYTAVIRALRAALPERTTLSHYDDHADHAEIRHLYVRAISLIDVAASQPGVA